MAMTVHEFLQPYEIRSAGPPRNVAVRGRVKFGRLAEFVIPSLFHKGVLRCS